MSRTFARVSAFALSLAAFTGARAQDTASAPAPANSKYAAPVAPTPIVTDATPQENGIPLSIDQCVAQALAKNFSVQIQTFSIDSAKAGVIIAQSTYDPTFGVSWEKVVNKSDQLSFVNQTTTSGGTTTTTGNGGASTTGGTTTTGGSGTTTTTTYFPRSNDQTTTLSASQNIITGGSVTANYIVAHNMSNSAQAFLNPAYDGNVSLNITQPLLQGAGTDYARAAIQIARYNVSLSKLSFKSTILSTILNVETAYYNLIFARRQLMVGQDNVVLAQRLLDENTTKRQTGVLTDLDVVQAQAGLATAQSQLISDRQQMENAEDTLFAAMGEREFKAPVGVVAFPTLPDTNVSFYVSYKHARDDGPNLAIAQTMIEQLKLDALRAKRNFLPLLDVNGGAGYLTARDSFYNAATKVWNGPGYNWQAGVTLSVPWGLRQSKALYRQARDSMNAEQVTYDQTDQQLTVQVRADVRAVTANLENVTAAGQAATLSQKQYDLQKARFDAGLATSYDVLQAQLLLSQARVSEIQAEVNLRLALAALHFLEGSSLAFYHVNLE